MLKPTTLLIALVAVAAVGCDDITVPDYNNPSIEDLQTNPTPTGIISAATGLLTGARLNIADPNAYVSLLGILGRESYNFDVAEPRFIQEVLVGPLTPGGAFGGNLWTVRYRNIRNANILLNALDEVAGFTEAQKNGLSGFAKTIQALDYLLVINTRDTNGAVIDTDRPLSEGPGPLVPRGQVMAHVADLLDEASTDLQAAGSSFVFPLGGGFDDFDTPATFLRFNRALKARVEAYRGNYSDVLTALGASFLDPSASLDLGAYYTYSTGAGDQPNNLNAATLRVHPSVRADAQRRPGGELDLRVVQKTASTTARGQLGLSSDVEFTIYPTNNSPVPIITNEELLLLRAEARWFTGNQSGAVEDLNRVRSQAGGLAPIPMPASDAAFVTALLYERRYSLLFEGHRWIDLRRFDRLTTLPLDLPTHSIQARFPVPEPECLARGLNECSAAG